MPSGLDASKVEVDCSRLLDGRACVVIILLLLIPGSLCWGEGDSSASVKISVRPCFYRKEKGLRLRSFIIQIFDCLLFQNC